MAACADTAYVLDKLTWMRERKIWPNGLRYLWTDAFGVILLVSLYRELNESKYLGEMLWMTHFFPEESWARIQQPRCLSVLERMWRDAGYFCREPYLPDTKIAFPNYGVSVGLQAVDAMPDHVKRLNDFF